jgi:hypothetical protein
MLTVDNIESIVNTSNHKIDDKIVDVKKAVSKDLAPTLAR